MDGFLAINAAGQARALACEPDSGPILRALPPARTFRRRLDRGRSHTARPGPHRCTRVLCLTAVVAVFFRVLIMWVYNGSGRSVIIVGLFHSAFNITIGNEVMPEPLNLPASETSLMCLGVLAVLAVAVVVFTRGRLAYQGPTGRSGGSSGSTEGALTTHSGQLRSSMRCPVVCAKGPTCGNSVSPRSTLGYRLPL